VPEEIQSQEVNKKEVKEKYQVTAKKVCNSEEFRG
jgi:hypothetical protein